jgi:hypothetical protein
VRNTRALMILRSDADAESEVSYSRG